MLIQHHVIILKSECGVHLKQEVHLKSNLKQMDTETENLSPIWREVGRLIFYYQHFPLVSFPRNKEFIHVTTVILHKKNTTIVQIKTIHDVACMQVTTNKC